MNTEETTGAEAVEEMHIDEPIELTPRQQKIVELKALIGVLESEPDMRLPQHFGSDKYNPIIFFPRDVTEAAAIQRKFGGRWEKNDPNESSYNANYLVLSRLIDKEIHVQIVVDREQVCEKKIVGKERKKVRKVVREAVYEEVYEDVDVIDFECGSLLSAAAKLELDRIEREAK